MKKIGILLVLLSAISLASYEEVNANFNRIEADYEKFISLEDQQYNKLKENASKNMKQILERFSSVCFVKKTNIMSMKV